jgi:hypothetical protein
LIAVIKNSAATDPDAVNTLALRDQVIPLADWLEVSINEVAPAQQEDWLQRKLSGELSRKHMHVSQLVIVGWRDAARFALDLILKGAITCAGIVAVDVPYSSPLQPIAATPASIRIIGHGDGTAPQESGLINALRRQDADLRFMTLPVSARHARDVTTRATAVFLSELTSKACRQSPASKGSNHV